MKVFHNETDKPETPIPENGVAALLLETVPRIMRFVRGEMRRGRAPGLSLPQFRTLIFLYHHEGVSLSRVAEHIGLQLPSMSKIVDALVGREFVIRETSSEDRRCVKLRLSDYGRAEILRARADTVARLNRELDKLTPTQRAGVEAALSDLHSIFTPGSESSPDEE